MTISGKKINAVRRRYQKKKKHNETLKEDIRIASIAENKSYLAEIATDRKHVWK